MATLEERLEEATALLRRVDCALEDEGPWLVLQGKIRCFLSRAPAGEPEPEKPPELKCISCGLLRCDELTVSVRWDGMVRCADCAVHRDTTGKEKWR